MNLSEDEVSVLDITEKIELPKTFQSILMISTNQVNVMQNNEPKRTAQSIRGKFEQK